jgi:hypothetical protein
MGQVASELLARAVRSDGDLPVPPFEWVSADLGKPLVDLEDKEELRRALDGTR